MSFRRSLSWAYSSREWNTIRLKIRHDEASIETWIDFTSRDERDDKEQISLPNIGMNKESIEVCWYSMWKDDKKIREIIT